MKKPTPQRGMNVRQLTEISRYSVRASRNLLLISGGVAHVNAKKPTPQRGMGFLISQISVRLFAAKRQKVAVHACVRRKLGVE